MHVSLAPLDLSSALADWDFPVAERFVDAFFWLVEHEYDQAEIQGALYHFATFGTAECCPWVRPEDRRVVESLLPLDPAFNDPEWSDDRFYGPGLDPIEPVYVYVPLPY
jgi:hypothetical protein